MEGGMVIRERVWALTALCAYQLQGTLRIILEPLLEDKPFVGAVTIFFLQKPVSSKPRDRPDAFQEQTFNLPCWDLA